MGGEGYTEPHPQLIRGYWQLMCAGEERANFLQEFDAGREAHVLTDGPTCMHVLDALMGLFRLEEKVRLGGRRQ